MGRVVVHARVPNLADCERGVDDGRTLLLLLAPGWVRTDTGGPDASLGIEDSIPNLVNTVCAQAGKPGLQYLDYLGRTVPW